MKTKFTFQPWAKSFILTFVLGLILVPHAFALRWANQFVEFELPAKWQCQLEQTEYVCQNTDDKKKREAIIILAAKLRGNQDSLDQYLAYLKSPKNYKSITGAPVKSVQKWAKIEQVNSHPWADSLHLESEVPGYYTRYLATVKQDIGVLVTYSVNKDKYQNYLNEFKTLVATLRVFRQAGGINAKPAGSNLFNTNTALPKILTETNIFPDPIQTSKDESAVQKTGSGNDDDMLFIIIVGALVIGFIIIRKRQQGG
jgi:hypothetical protein